MIEVLKINYGHLFEDELIREIYKIGTLKKVPEGQKLIEIIKTNAYNNYLSDYSNSDEMAAEYLQLYRNI